MNIWIILVIAAHAHSINHFYFHWSLAKHPFVNQPALKQLHRRCLCYKDFRRIHVFDEVIDETVPVA